MRGIRGDNVKSHIYARFQQKGIPLEDMKGHQSCETDKRGQCLYKLPGLTATQDAEYIARGIGSLVESYPDRYHKPTDMHSEIVLFYGKDTGTRCIDGHPVVHPTKIVKRIPLSKFVDWKHVTSDKGYQGTDFSRVEDVLRTQKINRN